MGFTYGEIIAEGAILIVLKGWYSGSLALAYEAKAENSAREYRKGVVSSDKHGLKSCFWRLGAG